MKICPQCGSEYGLELKFCPTDGSALRTSGADANSLVGQIIAERYHVLRLLGEGGMGQVYLAEHVKMGRMSAIKVLSPTTTKNADAITRFNREASNASRISHSNVAAIYDFGETRDGLMFLAMEYVDGEPLTALIEREGALPPARVAAIVAEVAKALDAAHELGIVHRDLKPDNIMIARAGGRDGADRIKVVDFGIAKAALTPGQHVTRTGLVIGTPEYMSPEQLSGDEVDRRSDIYALGLVAFHMLTGTLPFQGKTAQESLILRLTDRPRSLHEVRSDIIWPARLQLVLDRALSRYARDRHERAGEFAADLARATDGSLQKVRAASAGSAETRLISQDLAPTRESSGGAYSTGEDIRGRRRRPKRGASAFGVAAIILAVAVAAYARSSERELVKAPLSVASDPVPAAPAGGADSSRANVEPRPVILRTEKVAPKKRLPAPGASQPSPSDPPRAKGHQEGEDGAQSARETDRLIALMETEGTAERARQVEALIRSSLPRMQSSAKIMRARFHLGQAAYLQDRKQEACDTWASLRDSARAVLKRQVEYFHTTYCQ